MKKIVLNVDALAVESFAPDAEPKGLRGTVHGHIAIHPIGADVVQQLPAERRLSLTPGIGSRAIGQG